MVSYCPKENSSQEQIKSQMQQNFSRQSFAFYGLSKLRVLNSFPPPEYYSVILVQCSKDPACQSVVSSVLLAEVAEHPRQQSCLEWVHCSAQQSFIGMHAACCHLAWAGLGWLQWLPLLEITEQKLLLRTAESSIASLGVRWIEMDNPESLQLGNRDLHPIGRLPCYACCNQALVI